MEKKKQQSRKPTRASRPGGQKEKASKAATSKEIEQAAKKLLGFSELRPGQEVAIRLLVEGRDTLVVQPTGSGKSAIYQLAGALKEGSTVIVSPLIALQKDQVETIAATRLDEAVLMNSTLSAAEQREIAAKIEEQKVQYIFLAPEQLRKEETLERLRSANVSLFVIDEAHCISQWGHDFRPDYLELSRTLESLGRPTTLAMTATASQEVREDIIHRLGMRSPKVLVRDFDRPNISLRVDMYSTEEEKHDALLRRIEFAEKPGIVYVATHRNAETIAEELQQRGVEAVAYHGGLKAKDRDAIQNRFMSGDMPVIVSTNAFGMGVDKADIRFVYHADVSDSLDAYYQEVGRGGRDGEPAEAVLFYRPQDINAQRYKASSGSAPSGDLEMIATALAEQGRPATPAQLAEATALSERKAANIVHKLEEAGAARKLVSGEIELTEGYSSSDVTEAATQQQDFQKELRRKRLQQMQEYAESRSCRREYLLRYFGDDYSGPCGNCDRCELQQSGSGKVA